VIIRYDAASKRRRLDAKGGRAHVRPVLGARISGLRLPGLASNFCSSITKPLVATARDERRYVYASTPTTSLRPPTADAGWRCRSP
jgi:hypothetical protein